VLDKGMIDDGNALHLDAPFSLPLGNVAAQLSACEGQCKIELSAA
jgi:hypothetical protein